MFVAIALVFPVLLLLATLGMERVERPLDRARVSRDVEGVLGQAPDGTSDVSSEAVETMVSAGFRTDVLQYWRRQRARSSARKSPRARAAEGHDAVAPDLRSAPRGG